MNILFLSRWYPVPPDNGSKIRILNLLKALCGRHSVTLLSFTDPGENAPPRSFLKPGPVGIHVCPYEEFRPYSNRALRGFFSRQPRWLIDTYCPGMESLIRRTLEKSKFDLVIASQTPLASYYQCFKGIPSIFEEVELGCFYPDTSSGPSPVARMRARLRWGKHRRYIAGLLAHFSLCTVTSEVERRMVGEISPRGYPVHIIPNSIDVNRYEMPVKDRVPGSLIFAGSLSYSANLDAMTWFLRDIYPIIRSKRKDVSLTITGDPGSAKLPEAPDVMQTGRVEDVHGLVAGSMVSIAPIRIGGGTRLKILEAFALRTPVVATSKAAEGLDIINGEHILIADTPEDFARSVLHLLKDPGQAGPMADRAYELVRTRYNWNTISRDFLNLVDQAATKSVESVEDLI